MSRTNQQLQESFGYIVNKTSKMLLKRLNQEFMRRGYNLTWEQFEVLMHLRLKEGQRQQHLAEKLYKDKTTMTRLLKNVEALNLLKRLKNSKDQREKLVYLTNSGEKLLKILTGIAHGVLRKTQTGIDPKDLDICRNVLRRAHKTLSEELP